MPTAHIWGNLCPVRLFALALIQVLTRADPGPFLLLLVLQSVPGADRRAVVGRRLPTAGCRLPIAGA